MPESPSHRNLQFELAQSRDKITSLEASIARYEEQIRSLQQIHWENLQRESRRHHALEKKNLYLEQRIEELEYLVNPSDSSTDFSVGDTLGSIDTVSTNSDFGSLSSLLPLFIFFPPHSS
eukprot:TRINITY_DN11487_c0_g1_i1.p1 TRINITY_DN11487_c0_g1~~TRINITY_DN11487_c0_g1_i1.p1  ORF type:complete len:120 (-),score=28.20 TRINITY_DN11487_c0_g1_i1:526-885(-)